MKKLLICVGTALVLGAGIAWAQQYYTNLFTTADDFAGWFDGWVGAQTETATWDFDAVTVNGLGNTTAPNQAGTAGALQLTWSSGNWGAIAWSPGEQSNPYFMHAINPGSIAAWSEESGGGPGQIVSWTSVIKIVFTLPDNQGGSYFWPGIVFNYDGNWDTFYPTDMTYLGTDTDGREIYEYTIPYTLDATQLTYFQFGIIYNSDYSPLEPFYMDGVRVLVPEPTVPTIIAIASICMLMRRWSRT